MKWAFHQEAAAGGGSVDLEAEIAGKLAECASDIRGAVMFMYPWGEKGSPLETINRPFTWQEESYDQLSYALLDTGKAQQATVSGKGIGKSTYIATCTQALMSTRAKTRGIITAGTEPQLRTKTWPEFAKWFNMLICNHWFDLRATSMEAKGLDSGGGPLAKVWRLDQVTWSAENRESFQGLHNLLRRQFIAMDEASQIDDVIWEAADGIMTDADTESIMLAFGNGTRGEGRFFDCFHKMKKYWLHRQIDSRSVPITDKREIAKWAEYYGIDHDYFLVNVRGMFPRVSSMQFIGHAMVDAARKRDPFIHLQDACVLGVDVARFGDDETVLAPRKGRDARSIPWLTLRGVDTMQIAAAISDMNSRLKFDSIFIDAGGVGGGVVDRCRQLNIPNVFGVQFGAKADRTQVQADPTRYANKRAEMWGVMRANLVDTAIPDDQQLEDQLCAVQYGQNDRDEVLLEKKKDLKKRLGISPDRADALALTFAYPVNPLARAGGLHADGRDPYKAEHEYDPLAEAA